MSNHKFTYWELQAIRKLGREAELEAFSASLETIRIVECDDAYKEALLSEKPLKGCVVHDPRLEVGFGIKPSFLED